MSSLLSEWISGGVANAFASALLNPFDVAKTRSQIDPRMNLILAFRSMYSEGGLLGLWRPGLTASVIREMLSSGPRAGFYVPVRDGLVDLLTSSSSSTKTHDEVAGSFAVKCLAAMTTGTLGSVIANPIDVVKIRLMVHPGSYPSGMLLVRLKIGNGAYAHSSRRPYPTQLTQKGRWPPSLQ